MPRDLPIGNGQLLIGFDADHQIRDLYYPYVGKENHAGGYAFRFGVMVGSTFRWICAEQGFFIENKYEPDTLVTDVRISHKELGIILTLKECVDFHENFMIRRIDVENTTKQALEVRLFFHQDFRISESDVGDTAAYDPRNQTVLHYKGNRYFLINLCTDEQAGILEYATGQKGYLGKEGTFKDAEDGTLSKNAISQGSVDSVVSTDLMVQGNSQRTTYYWMIAGQKWTDSWDSVFEMNRKVVERGPESFLERTRNYWRLWSLKEPIDFANLPKELVTLYHRSLLIVRTQIDNRGAILAANDTDILAFNRDTYSYMWPRDGAFVAHALDLAGYPELSLRFFEFCAEVITQDGYLFQKYNPDQSLASSWHPWVVNGKSQLPIQEDETALVVFALWKHFERYRDVELIKPLYGRFIRKAADFMVSYRDPFTLLPGPSYDLWEERRGISSYTCAAVYGGLSAAAEFAMSFGDTAHAKRYLQAAKEIRTAMDTYLWQKEAGRFARMIQVKKEGRIEVDLSIDASLWGLFAFGAYDATDEKIRLTFLAIKEHLWCKTKVGGMARYVGDQYHAVSQEEREGNYVPGNPWFLCTLWYADYLIAIAQTPSGLEEALSILQWVSDHGLKSGVLAEQLHPTKGTPLSVAPLTWTHAAYIATVQAYLEKQEWFAQKEAPTQVLYKKMRMKALKSFGHIHGMKLDVVS